VTTTSSPDSISRLNSNDWMWPAFGQQRSKNPARSSPTSAGLENVRLSASLASIASRSPEANAS
jgi:hypothetical protein